MAFPEWKMWFDEDEATEYAGSKRALAGLPNYTIGRKKIYSRHDLNRARGEAPADKNIFSLQEASVYTAVPVGSLRRHIYELNNLTPLIIGNAAMFTRDQLDEFVMHGRSDTTPDPDYYFSTAEAADYLDITPEYLGQLVHVEEVVKATKIGNSLVYTRDELDRYKSGRVPAET